MSAREHDPDRTFLDVEAAYRKKIGRASRRHPEEAAAVSRTSRYRAVGAAAAIGYVATIFLANWLIQNVGVINVGFGLYAPAGVLAVGLAFTLRDIVQRTLGREAVVIAIVVGAGLSWLVAPTFAVASGVAFLVSELADFAVYTPLERRSWLGAVALSNTVGLLVDSWLFLTLAFGSLEFFWGQVVGKAYMTVLAILLLAAGRAVFSRDSQTELA